MTLFVTFLALLFVFLLWIRIREITHRLYRLGLRFKTLERRVSDLDEKLNNLRGEEIPQQETAPAESETTQPIPEKERPPEKEAAPEPSAPPPPEKEIIPEQPPQPPTKETPPIPSAEPVPRETPPPRPPTPPPPTVPPFWKLPKFDWESLVGVKLFSWIAGVALLLAAIFFLQHSIKEGWLTPPVQMAIGVLVGIGLLIVCELRAARKYRITANAMDASAIAILFSTFYAGHVRWELIGAITAFLFMVLVTAVAVLLSIRRDSLFIALLGLIGAFATPALLSIAEEPIPLFSYILLLNAGLAWVATKKRWPLLTTLTLIFTFLYQWVWVINFLTYDQLPIAIGIFLVFPILAFVAIALGQKEEPEKGWISLHGQTANLSALLPLLFVLYIAAVPEYGHRYILMFGFLLLMDIGLFAISAVRGPERLHFVGGLSTILIAAIWFGSSYESHAWPGILIFILLFAFFYLAAPFIAKCFGNEFTDTGNTAAYAAPLLLFIFPVLAAVEPACVFPGMLFGVLFLILLGASAYAIITEKGPAYFIAALFTLLAEAVWAAKHLDSERLLSGLALFGIFGLFYIAVPIASRHWKKKLEPETAGPVLLLISLVLLFFLASGPIAATAIWGLALLLLILNAGLFFQGSASKLPMIAIAGMVLSWIILAVLWASVSLAAILIPALVVMVGFALFILAGNIWMQRQATGSDAGILGNGLFLGLTGHVFLFVVASQRSLSDPPWPFLGILFLLNLAIGTVVLYTRRITLHQAAMVVSALLLMVWISTAEIVPWPHVGILTGGALALFSIVWIYFAKRIGMDTGLFATTAAITVVLAQIITIVAADQAGSPEVGFLIAAHAIFLIAIFSLEWFRGKYTFAVIAILPTAIAVSFWIFQHAGAGHWQQQLLFASIIYLLFIAYPLILGRRCGRSFAPYLAAILAGIPFFFQARHAIIRAEWEHAIGILPVAQALLMTLLMVRLLGIEPRGARALGRLALVAGAGLAFITAAIPLQLEREWIIIGWALEGVALAWLYGKIPHKGLIYALSGLFSVVFIWLVLNPVVTTLPRGELRIWNWYLYTYLVSSAALMLGGWMLSKNQGTLASPWNYLPRLLPAGGALLLFAVLNIEIADFYSTGSTIAFKFTATLEQDMTYTLGWALFAVALLAAGILTRSQSARIASLALLVATIFKCFIHDLARLVGLYRVFSFVGLAICLTLVAVALQKFVLSTRKEEK